MEVVILSEVLKDISNSRIKVIFFHEYLHEVCSGGVDLFESCQMDMMMMGICGNNCHFIQCKRTSSMIYELPTQVN